MNDDDAELKCYVTAICLRQGHTQAVMIVV